MAIKIGITGRSGSLGRELVKLKTGYSYSFFKGDIRNVEMVDNSILLLNLSFYVHLQEADY